MGNAESSGASSGPYTKVGYHVLLVTPNSPSAGILFPFWDIIVGSQGQVFEKDDGKLVQLFSANVGKPLPLHVYSLKTERTREVTIVPNNNWGSAGLVGLHIRFGSFDSLLELVWHVLDVYVDSPASEAQLVARTDYIIGIPERAFADPEDFFNHINTHLNTPVQLFVYSAVSEDVRIVTITPNAAWGGNGTLGCDIGYGYLHRIPSRPATGQAPRNSLPYIYPASPSAPSPSAPPSSAIVPPTTSPAPPVSAPPPSTVAPLTPPPSTSAPRTPPPAAVAPVTPPSSSPSASPQIAPRTATPPPASSSPSPSTPSTPPLSSLAPTPAPTPVANPPPSFSSPSSSLSYPPTYTTPFAPLSAFAPPSSFLPPSSLSSAPYDPSIRFVPAPLPPYPTSSLLPPPSSSSSSVDSPLQKNSIMTPMSE